MKIPGNFREDILFEETASPVNSRAIERLVEKLLSAKQPVFYVGGGIVTSDAADELLDLAELLKVPVTPTLMGLGGFPTALA